MIQIRQPEHSATVIRLDSLFAHGDGLPCSPIERGSHRAKIPNHRVLTDLTGDFNRVILEFEVENIGGFEARLKDYGTNPAFREKMKGYTGLWVTGSREILQVA